MHALIRHAVAVVPVLAGAAQLQAQHLSAYGTPGLIDMPTAETLADGTLAMTAEIQQSTARGTLTFQMLPRVYGAFRYSYVGDFSGSDVDSRYDRSFDLHFQLREETARAPALAVGLRDFAGTGVYSGEYVVATKTVADRWSITGGVGWGRLAGRGAFENPLAVFGDRFKTRPDSGFEQTGQLNTGTYFRGDAAIFGGVKYRVSDRLVLLAEYSSDTYPEEAERAGFVQRSPFNLGVSVDLGSGAELGGYFLYGTTLALRMSYVLDPRAPAAPGGLGPAAPALSARQRVALASWNLPDRPPEAPGPQQVLAGRLNAQGLRLVGYRVKGSSARIEIENMRYGASAQAAGRAARAMANTLPARIELFEVVLTRQGVPISAIRTRRSDLYAFETDLDGAWRSLSAAQIADAPAMMGGQPGAYPYLGYRLSPYLQLGFFDPDRPLRYEFGVEFQADYTLRPGFTFSGALRQPVGGTLDDATRVSDSVLPHVRSDWAIYAQESDTRINHLTGEYIWRTGRDGFARLTAGYLEPMFAGVSAELLWAPQGGRLALGGELNYARQRDFDILFGLQDYDVITGRASVYYDFPGDYRAQIDLGRYLAGDWGATIALDREFNNGFRVGAFATFTDVSKEAFGEGAFDKGIRLSIPVSWLTGRPSRSTLNQTIRPVLRDGGARLNVRNRLYEFIRADRADRIAGQWGRYFR